MRWVILLILAIGSDKDLSLSLTCVSKLVGRILLGSVAWPLDLLPLPSFHTCFYSRSADIEDVPQRDCTYHLGAYR